MVGIVFAIERIAAFYNREVAGFGISWPYEGFLSTEGCIEGSSPRLPRAVARSGDIEPIMAPWSRGEGVEIRSLSWLEYKVCKDNISRMVCAVGRSAGRMLQQSSTNAHIESDRPLTRQTGSVGREGRSLFITFDSTVESCENS